METELVRLPDFDRLIEDDSYLVNLGRGVWLMDDHRWALKVWETQLKKRGYTLVHADYHWDGCYDFHNAPDEEARLLAAGPVELARLVADGELIRYDSFIAPAVKRGLVRTVHFFCLQNGPDDDALNEDFLQGCGATQVLHKDIQSLATAEIAGPLIFDLCLDLFNRATQWCTGELWADGEIRNFLSTVDPLLRQSEIVTVSLSFNYSGTKADTRHLAKLVLPAILENRSAG